MVKAKNPARTVIVFFVTLVVTISIPISVFFLLNSDFDFRGKAATGKTWTVCPSSGTGCDFVGGEGIQQAINAAKSGDTVIIKGGTYAKGKYTLFSFTSGRELCNYKVMYVVSNKDVTIKGQGTVEIDGSKSVKMGAFGVEGASKVNIENVTIKDFEKEESNCDPCEQGCSLGTGLLLHDTANVTLKGSIIKDVGEGIYLRENSTLTAIGNKIVRGKERGIRIDDSASAKIKNNLIRENGFEGIAVEDGKKVDIINNTIVYNKAGRGVGGISLFRSPDVLIKNNIITHNKSMGIYRSIGVVGHVGDLEMKYNNSWGNSGQDYEGYGRDSSNISKDPKYSSITKVDYHLKTGSPCINTGDPNIKDKDKSRSDMGAYGGPDVCVLDPDYKGCEQNPKAACAEEGESVPVTANSKPCCEGFSKISCAKPKSDGTCPDDCVGSEICANCGNGTCGKGENKCNCPKDCKEDIPCVEEGESIPASPAGSVCCSGLESISCEKPDSTGKCPGSCSGADVCTKCGDGKCGKGENKCNCPRDCDEDYFSPADLNKDRKVNMIDYSLFVNDYLKYRKSKELTERSDLSNDGKISMADYAVFVSEYLKYRSITKHVN